MKRKRCQTGRIPLNSERAVNNPGPVGVAAGLLLSVSKISIHGQAHLDG